MKYLETEGTYNPLGLSHAVGHGTIFFRALRLVLHLIYGLLLAFFYPLLRLRSRQRLMRYWSRGLLEVFHVQLETNGYPPLQQMPGTLLVANHISWLDVFVMNAVSPSRFVAKSEVRSWPLIGLLCRLTMTIFLQRDVRRDTLRVNKKIAEVLSQGECVALFPEGTSSDGSQVHHFHGSLLQCVIDMGSSVHPVAIRYHDGTGRRSNKANFIGDMSLIQSLYGILSSPSLHATLAFLPAIPGEGENRRTLGSEAQLAISSAINELDSMTNSSAASLPLQESPHLQATSSQSMYSLLLDPVIARFKHHTNS
jgi:1-acyl-sn-glycerol-3-phosphate acyltransferase